MVKEGVAEIMYKKFGEITNDRDQLYKNPTKYKIIHPKYLIFVDKTDCNTIMKDDGFADGQLFLLPVL
jgi:hypothetical protein